MNRLTLNIYLLLLFMGMLGSCFQYSIAQFSKSKKNLITIVAEDDVEDTEDTSEKETEKNTEQEKKEVGGNCFLIEFNSSFLKTESSKTALWMHELKKLKYPALSINTPPPKV